MELKQNKTINFRKAWRSQKILQKEGKLIATSKYFLQKTYHAHHASCCLVFIDLIKFLPLTCALSADRLPITKQVVYAQTG